MRKKDIAFVEFICDTIHKYAILKRSFRIIDTDKRLTRILISPLL